MLGLIRPALHALVRRPALPLAVIALVALGVGFTAALWALVDAMLLRPLPYPQPDRLVAVLETHPERGRMAVTTANFVDWASSTRSFEAVAGAYQLDVSLASGGRAERVAGAQVTAGFFAVWGAAPQLGRTFIAADFAQRAPVAVIGDRLWRDHFGAKPDIVGATVRLDGASYTVVGVMPRAFRLARNEQVWVPWVMSADQERDRRFHLVGVVARLHDAGDRAPAQAELEATYARLRADHVEVTDWRPLVLPLRSVLVGDATHALPLLVGGVMTLVAVAWVNLFALLLGAWPARRAEILMRQALGASPRRIVAELLSEVAVWSALGGVCGLAIAGLVLDTSARLVLADRSFDFAPRVDWRVAGATIAFLAVTLVLAVLGPAVLTVTTTTEMGHRRHAPARSRAGVWASALQSAGVVVLVALAVSLAVGLTRLGASVTPEPGPRTLAMDVLLSEIHQPDDAQHRAFFDRLLAAMATRPEIARAGAASYVPPTPPQGNVRFAIEGRATASDAQSAVASAVDANALSVLGVTVRRGRAIEGRDGALAPVVAVVSEALARRYWPAQDALGQRLTIVGMSAPATIVGVVSDVPQPLAPDPRLEAVLYLSYQQVPWPFMTLLVDPVADAEGAIRAVREEVARLAPDQATGAVRLVHDLRTDWLVAPRARTSLVGLFAAATLALTLVGLFGSVRREVGSRLREFAIRQALGAQPAAVVGGLAWRAGGAAWGGLLAGAAIAVPVVARLAERYPDMAAIGVLPMAAVLTPLLAASWLSAYVPARRAGAANPADTLRAE